jgi:hypothetical protein
MQDTRDNELADLAAQDDLRLAEIFDRRGRDPQVLEALNATLKRRSSDAAIELHIKVAAARHALGLSAPHSTARRPAPSPRPVRDWLETYFHRHGIARPDGRPLYRYRMSDAEYGQAKSILRRLARERRLVHPDDRAGALFVAYCGEWFRRESSSTFLRWDDPAPDLFPHVPDAEKRNLTERGLHYWRRDLRVINGRRRYLLTLALEGGFPVRILADGAHGWLKDYLRAIMRRAIAGHVDVLDEIREIALEERGRMRVSYQHDDFVALCGELALSLLKLRQEAEAGGSDAVRNSTFLDATRPGWRDDLPIYVPPEDQALVAGLFAGLIDEKMTGLVTQGVEARRYLIKSEGEWRAAVQLLADGEVACAKLPGFPVTARARAIGAGELGEHIGGEIALFEPPAGEQRRWRVRPFTRTAKLLIDYPFAAPIAVTVSSPDSAPYAWTWPRGGAIRSDVLVFERDENSTQNEPLLRFIRSGSASSGAKTLYALVPCDWSIEPSIEGAVEEVEEIPALRQKLVRLKDVTYFHGGEDAATRFRVAPDADEMTCELDLGAHATSGYALADERCEVVASGTHPVIHDRTKMRPPRPGELFVRVGGSQWKPLIGPLCGAGLMELSWRDPDANIQIEKRRLAIVPGDAALQGKMLAGLEGAIVLSGLSGWTATIRDHSCHVETTSDEGLSFRFIERPSYRLAVKLAPSGGHPFDVLVPLIGRDAVIALSDGAVVAPGAQIDLGTLRGATAVSPGHAEFHLGPKGSNAGLKVVFDGELPLGLVREAITEILAASPDQDGLAQIDFIGDTGRPIFVSRYRYPQIDHDADRIRWTAPQGTGAAPVARMILDPQREHALEPCEHGVWRIPKRCKGLCLVYVREGPDVISRPFPIVRPGRPDIYAGALISAMTTTNHVERQKQLSDALDLAGRGQTGSDDRRWLHIAATHLHGLPASALDALKLLPSTPQTLIRLLVEAVDAGDRSLIWSLQGELPFLWLAQPLRAWRLVLADQYDALVGALQTHIGRVNAAAEAARAIRSLREGLTTLEPGLAAVFDEAGPAPHEPTLRDLTSAYIQTQHQREVEAPNTLAARLAATGVRLPPEIESKSHETFAGLVAPALLAASAQEKLVLDLDLMLIARRTLREDPTYVSKAWPHLLKFYR